MARRIGTRTREKDKDIQERANKKRRLDTNVVQEVRLKLGLITEYFRKDTDTADKGGSPTEGHSSGG